MSIIKESRKKDFEDKIFKVINRSSEDILFLLIYKINYFIELLKKQKKYSSESDEIFLRMSGLVDLVHEIYFNYNVNFNNKFKFIIDDFIRLDDIDSRKYLFENIKKGLYDF